MATTGRRGLDVPGNTNRQNGDEQDQAAYEKDLASYLQERIKPGLSRSAIPLLARSIAKDIARSEPPEASDHTDSKARADAQDDDEQPELEADEQPDAEGDDERPDLEADEQPDAQSDEEQPEDLEADEQPDAEGDDEQPDFEANMYELQADLGEEWILRFSVQGDDSWLTAEREDGSQRVEAPDARRLVTIIDAIDECGGRQP
jgi:hypothetical protein